MADNELELEYVVHRNLNGFTIEFRHSKNWTRKYEQCVAKNLEEVSEIIGQDLKNYESEE